MPETPPSPAPTQSPVEPLYTHPASPFLRTESGSPSAELPALPAPPPSPIQSTWITYRTQIEFVLAMLAYLMVLIGSVTVLQANPGASWRYVVAVLPVAPAALTLWIFIRAISRMDELHKRIQMQA